jgi:hypothetical protein
MCQGPVTVLCTYRVIPGKDGASRDLLTRHWPTRHWLTRREAGLATERPTLTYMGEVCEDRGGRSKFEFPHVQPVEVTYSGPA